MRYVAFLRAVNVSGRFVTMAALRAGLEQAGFTAVQSHIQSGNIAVSTARRSVSSVRSALEESLERAAGFPIPAIVRTPAAVRDLVAAIDATAPQLSGARRYVAFADGPIGPDAREILTAWDKPGERVTVLGDSVVADLTVDFHRVKLTNARIEKITGRTSTWRDLKVVRAIDEKWSMP